MGQKQNSDKNWTMGKRIWMIEKSKIMKLKKEAHEMIAAKDGFRLALDGGLSPTQIIR